MKTWETILKIIAALIAAAGIIFIIVTYGDSIVAWFKKLFSRSEVTLYDDMDDNDEDELTEEGEIVAEESDFATE